MNKQILLEKMIAQLESDLDLLDSAARKAHEAATHEENIPDNKYETLALEASYLAQGQANRAQQIRLALADYRTLALRNFVSDQPVRLTALVVLEDEEGRLRRVFLGPSAGGLRVMLDDVEVTVVTPESPLGKALLGRQIDDRIELGEGPGQRVYEIVAVA
ncbi:transcription elongation factor GreAB [Geothermobacter hydrogeniphilus]|uniref:Transcription elongation factor GreAB n=1 Tax=Geothermobacter hydrogeniphilus TaxID=1969733 RepID=A0A2K2H6E3_9BACT|nr:GreA/GreB family elongation factor [Geothermobacter hydrogeniphilus]PNU18894.1 transcription elongation factor GreAB [Geothermobacter hydrogeniphilus]